MVKNFHNNSNRNKNHIKRNSYSSTDKYISKIFGRQSKNTKGYISPYGEVTYGNGLGSGIKGNGITDPMNSIVRRSFLIDNECYFIDVRGLAKKGQLMIKTERLYDEIGRYLGKKELVALDKKLDPRLDWHKQHNKAMFVPHYILNQLLSCGQRQINKKIIGYVYTPNFEILKFDGGVGFYETILNDKIIQEAWENDREALDLYGKITDIMIKVRAV